MQGQCRPVHKFENRSIYWHPDTGAVRSETVYNVWAARMWR